MELPEWVVLLIGRLTAENEMYRQRIEELEQQIPDKDD